MEASTESCSGNEWELSKENVQPLKQGRKMANLTAALAPSSVDQTRIFREKQEFEAQIRTYEGDDPLDIWYRYIIWTSENFPKGGKELGDLLERCMTTFRDQERYKNDERYAKVWLRYSDICTDPMEIFQYMHSQQVCSKLALFYEAWAQLLEGLGDHKKADEVYNLGIQRNAQPLESLKKQLKVFEMRLAERVSSGLQKVSLGEDSELARVSLGGLKRQGRKGTVGTKRTGNATLSKTGGIGVPLQTSNSKNSGFKIFCGDNPGAQSSLPHSTGEWQMPPTQPVIKKENTQKPGKWTDTKLSQRYHASVPLSGIPQKPDFSVHVDEDVGSLPPPTPQQIPQFDKVLSARKPDKPFVVEALRNKTHNLEGQKTRVMYCKEKIYAGTAEFSFEELRAARVFAKRREGKYQPPVTEPQPENNVRYMYPKKEVYSFDGEFQYEEILARRYLARRKKQSASKKQVWQEKQVPQENRVPVSTRGFPSNDEACPMEIGSCQKSGETVAGPPGYEDGIFHSTSTDQSSTESTARRGLSFTDQRCTQLPPSAENLNTVASSNYFHEPAFTVPPNTLQSGYRKSAFQPVRHGLQFRPHQDEMTSKQENPVPPPSASKLLNMSSCNDTENMFVKPVSQVKVPEASVPETTPLNDTVFRRETSTGNKFIIFSRTPDANRSGDFNNSNLTGPSPTVFTKQALMVVGDMFSGPLESERAQDMDQTDKDFEAAFSNDCTTHTFSAGFGGSGGFGGGADFVIYDENAVDMRSKGVENTEEDTEDKENMPPVDNRQETAHRPLAGILQPSVGIPTCSLENDEDEDDEMLGGDDGIDANTQPKNYQETYQHDKTSDVSLADFTHDQTTFASTSFATAAHMASTPFCHGIGPSSLPSIPMSTIRPINDNPVLASEEVEYSSTHAHVSQTGGSFTSSPGKALSPIMERSHEDSKSTNSSRSSNASSRRGSCSVTASQQNGLELSKIQEETSFRATDSAPQDDNVGSAVINPFSGDVVDCFLSKITPPLSTYYGFFEFSEEMPRIATNASVYFGKDDTYHVEKLIGSGAFAKVYLARKRGPDFNPDDIETDDESYVVLKVQKISIEWEFYTSRQLHSRMQDLGCSKELHEMFMNPLAAYVYPHSSVLLDRYKPLGTILDMVNKYKMKKKTMEEGVVFFYTIALLRILETLHACDIIHGDIKPDNFLVLDSDVDSPDGTSLKVIDFGRSIDMKLFPAGTTFTTNCYTDDFQCIEMKEGRPWTTQIDTYGILGTIHCLLFLDYMKVYKDDKGRWKVNKTFKRHYNPIWSTLFDSLLNTPSCKEQPSLRDFREEFQRLYQTDEVNYIRQRQRHDVFMF